MGPLGRYMAAVHGSRDDGSAPGDRVFGPVERAVYRPPSATSGVDLTRTVVRILLPLSLVAGLFLVSQGVIQNLDGFRTVTTVEGAVQSVPGARWPARWPSSSSAPTAGASSTPTPPTRSRTPRR